MQAWAVALLVGSAGCRKRAVDFENRPCSFAQECLSGFACHPELSICAPTTVVGCGVPNAVCPSGVDTGDSCDQQNAFIPCVEGAADCERGCRTCLDSLTWSECSQGGCVPSNYGVEKCDGRDNDCNDSWDDMTPAAVQADCALQFPDAVNVAQWGCAVGSCRIVQCAAGWVNTSGTVDDGCALLCTPDNGAVETCDDRDNDCNGFTDKDDPALTSQDEVDADCITRLPGAGHVRAWDCVVGACMLIDCDDDYYNRDGDIRNGCEVNCISVSEVCDHLDNDCDGVIDNDVDHCACRDDVPPAASEICGNGIDDDCNQVIDDPAICKCTPSLAVCADARTLHTCNSTGTDWVPDVTCQYMCVNGVCVSALNGTNARMNACVDTADVLALTGTMVLTYDGDSIDCLDNGAADCGSVAATDGGTGSAFRVACLASLTLPAGAQLVYSGNNLKPLVLLVDGDVQLEGDIILDGNDGRANGKGEGAPGAGDGGNGGSPGNKPGAAGAQGRQGGGGGVASQHKEGAGGGGGGYGTAGAGGGGGHDGTSSTVTTSGGSGGEVAGSRPDVLDGGNGGGGGSTGPSNEAGGGGGGGGAIQITTRGQIVLNGHISANGGVGGVPNNDGNGGGGGGSGGGIILEAPAIAVGSGTHIRVNGGDGGAVSTNAGGVGAVGSTSAAAGTNGTTGPSTSVGGGGGGGGGGRVYLRTNSATGLCNAVSPALTAVCTQVRVP